MKDRIDIIVGKLKPMADKPKMKMDRKDDMQSSDFVQEIDMDEHSMMHEMVGEAVLQAIKQSDAKALGEALCDLVSYHMNEKDSEDDSEEL